MSLVAVSIGAAAYMISRNPEFTERWQYTYYEGDTTGRDVIFREAMGMILEQPIFGWSSGGAFYELGRRVGLPNGRDAHNLILTVLLGVGFFGALPFFVGLWMCGRGAWRARFGNLELLPMALFATLFAAGLSGTTLLGKTQWFVLGLTLAATSSSVREVAVKRVAVSLAVQSFRRRSFVTSRFSH
jgi:O-antigen ligase